MGDLSQQWWRTFEKSLVEKTRFRPATYGSVCVLAETALESLKRVARRRLEVPSGGVGPTGCLRGILGVHVHDQINGDRGVRWENAMKQLRARYPFRKWVSGSDEFTGSWLEQQPDFSFVQSRRRTKLTSRQPRRDATQNQTTVPLLSKLTNTCPRRSKVTG